MWICRMLFEVSRIKFVSEEWKILKIDIRMGFKIRYIKSDGRLICKVVTLRWRKQQSLSLRKIINFQYKPNLFGSNFRKFPLFTPTNVNLVKFYASISDLITKWTKCFASWWVVRAALVAFIWLAWISRRPMIKTSAQFYNDYFSPVSIVWYPPQILRTVRNHRLRI